MAEFCFAHPNGPPEYCHRCDLVNDLDQFAGDYYEWKNELEIQARWAETRAYVPPLILQRVAGRFPELEGLCNLLPEDRLWYLGKGPALPLQGLDGPFPGVRCEWPEEYIRGSYFAHLPDWAFEALKS